MNDVDIDKKEKLYQNHILTVLRNRDAYKYPADLHLVGFEVGEYPRVVKELDFDETLFHGFPGFPEKKEEQPKFEEGINWLEDIDYYNSWKRLKRHNISLLAKSENLFQLFTSCDIIEGKPQMVNPEHKETLRLVTKAVKMKNGVVEKISYKMIDDHYNRRDDGYEEEILEESFWVTNVTSHGEKYIVLSEEKIESTEMHIFHGMKMKVPHIKEFEKKLGLRGSTNLFFCRSMESKIKPMPKNEIIPSIIKFMGENEFDVDKFKWLMKNYIFLHQNGKFYTQPELYTLTRNAILFSGKIEGYPGQIIEWGIPGKGKTIRLECMERVFEEGIAELGNSTLKAFLPSFKEKPANPGLILKANRQFLGDELMKLIDNAANATRSINDVHNQLGQLNFILEHKARTVGSGNDNTLYCKGTAKVYIPTNPSANKRYLYQELGRIDVSTISRIIPLVIDENHVKFIESGEGIKCANTYSLCSAKKTKTYKGSVSVYAHEIRDFYVSIYDSCQKFNAMYDQCRVEKIFKTLQSICQNKMISPWKARGFHHCQVLMDGIVKFRCLFEDFDESFEAKEQDYDMLEAMVAYIIKSWETDMGLAEGAVL